MEQEIKGELRLCKDSTGGNSSRLCSYDTVINSSNGKMLKIADIIVSG